DAVGAEDHGGVVRDLVELVHEVSALGPQRLHHVPVVDDLLPDVDGRRAHLQRQLDDVDGAVHSGAEPPGPGQHDVLKQRYGCHGWQYTGRGPGAQTAGFIAILRA